MKQSKWPFHLADFLSGKKKKKEKKKKKKKKL